ncbi:hypothetical protein ILUMI_06520 [Ignelater luminosus]|uniref:Myb/SANT-like DNA-binding domain-containing protein n=1 Tax=Ignelater luminosus TaxID=2038154 RepID=A0A8K0D548_IGNLU|nr:hypothetical protein ILUMI_06520 [Ignelater luminosus]
MENTINLKKAILEYEKPGIPKIINNKYKIVSIDNPNDFIFVDKEQLPNISDSFAVHVINVDREASFSNEDEIDEKCDPELILLKPENIETDVQEKRTIWTDEGTKLLLTLYKQVEPLLGSKQIRSKKRMWENISAEMNNAGFSYTAEQVENRFKTLIRAYRKVNQSETMLTKLPRTCIYQEEMDAILLKNSVKLAGDSVEIQYEQEDSNEDAELDDETDDLFDTINDSEKKNDWDEKASKLLLSLYKKKKPFIEKRKFKSKKEMWENIAAEINKRNYMFSGGQVENRFKTLLRGYKKVLKEGNKKKLFIYQDELDEIFVEDDDLFPEIISGSERKSLRKQVLERLGMEVDDIDEHIGKEDESLSQEENTSTLSILKEIRNELINAEKRAAERHYDLVKLLKEANEIQRRKTDLIEKYVALQKKPNK